MDEEWRVIQDNTNFSISNTGRVKNNKTNQIKIPQKDYKGYLRVQLYKKEGSKNYRIHRLVGKAFISNPLNLPEIDHIDRDKENNNVDNLRWVSSKENANNRVQDSKVYQQANSYRFTPIIATNIETGEEIHYAIQRDAEKIYGKAVNAVLRGRQKTCKGFIFRYNNENMGI